MILINKHFIYEHFSPSGEHASNASYLYWLIQMISDNIAQRPRQNISYFAKIAKITLLNFNPFRQIASYRILFRISYSSQRRTTRALYHVIGNVKTSSTFVTHVNEDDRHEWFSREVSARHVPAKASSMCPIPPQV